MPGVHHGQPRTTPPEVLVEVIVNDLPLVLWIRPIRSSL
jgi:hypothetical protein